MLQYGSCRSLQAGMMVVNDGTWMAEEADGAAGKRHAR